MKRQALFAEILLVDVIIDVEPALDGYLVELLVELRVMVDEAYQMGIVAGAGSLSQLLHQRLKALLCLVVAAQTLGGSLHTVA